MFKVTVNTSGEYRNIVLGARYCLTRKTAIRLANLFLGEDCDITVEKFICIGDVFIWSDTREETKIIFDEDEEGKAIARKARRDDY